MNAQLSLTPLSFLVDRRSGSTRSLAKAALVGSRSEKVTESKADPAKQEPVTKLEDTLPVLEHLDRRLKFRVDEQSGHTVISIVDSATSEVIKQIPAEEMLAIARRIETLLSEHQSAPGVLVTDEA